MDRLKLSCNSEGLEVVYTNNKFTLLSSSTENDIPTIRAHKIFKNCDEKTANAVIKYYINPKNESNLKIIEAYITKYYSSDQYKIKPPSKLFSQLLGKNRNDAKESRSSQDDMIEAKVLSITQKSFSGHVSRINPDNPVLSSEEDPIELDIIISPFNT